jgi:putative ABC transport system permease protein
VSIAANDMSQTVYGSGVLPEELLEKVRGLDGVREAYGVRIHVTEFRDTEVLVLAPDLRRWFSMMRERGMSMEGLPADEASLTALERGEAAVVSTNFVALHGRSLELETPAGRRAFRVVGAVDDFSWPKGVVILDLGVFRELWGERALTYIDVRVADGATVADVQGRVAASIGPDTRAFVHQTAQIKEFAHKVLAEAFKLTQAQVLIAMIIGFIGIFNTLLMSVLRRTREIGLLRAIGMAPSQAARTVAIEAVWTAAWGAVLGIVGGLFTMAFPISMHFLRITGYVLAFTIPWSTMAMACAAAVAIGYVAAWLPARRAAGLSVIEAIGYE